MEAGVKRRWAAIVFCAAVLAACGEQAPKVIVLTSNPPATPSVAPVGPIPLWQVGQCPDPEPVPAQASNLTFSGVCNFSQTGALTCNAAADDFYLYTRRTLASGLPVVFYINVESYHGPGTYNDNVQVLMTIQDGRGLYRWSDYHGAMTVGPGERTATLLKTAVMQPEPGTPTSGTEFVSGTIGCGGR